MDIIEDIITIPPSIIDDFVILIKLSTMAHSHIWYISDVSDI